MCCQIHTSLLSNNSLLSHCQTSSFLVCYLICFTLLLPKPLIIILSLSFLCFYFFLSFSPLRLLPFFFFFSYWVSEFGFYSSSSFFFFFFSFHIGFLGLVSIIIIIIIIIIFFSFLFTGFLGLVSLFFPWVLGLSG